MKKVITIGIISVLLMFTIACSAKQSRPDKPGPNYIWVPAHTQVNGNYLAGHWKYIDPIPAKSNRPDKPGSNYIWVPKHTKANGNFVAGHWKYVDPYPGKHKKGKKWVPGHYKPNGKWIPGHYRK
jgi:hypothetical protein